MTNRTPNDAGWHLDEFDGDRFWGRVNFRGGTAHEDDPLATAKGECWVWRNQADGTYAKFLYFERWEAAHRVAYKDFGNKVTAEQDIDHLCRNPRCVNPAHLEAVSRSENVSRGLRANHSGQCPKGHDYSSENTRIHMVRGKERKVCVTCDKARKRAAYERSKSAA